jgi:mRNA deadenylase 3'-5' endonuclease subunit Ccr4
MKLKIITYNILADYLNNPEFVLVNKKYLDNEYRMKLLLKKIDSVIENNSIIFLQEVGATQLSNLYMYFEKKNYKILYFRHLAICYPNKFKLEYIEMNKINTLSKKYIKDKNLRKKLDHFQHSYILAKLSHNNKKFTICTTHIVANPDYNLIKVYQSFLLSKRLEKEKNVIFCGDFNSIPSSESFKLLKTGKTKIDGQTIKIKNNFISLYDPLNKGEINITTHTSNKVTSKFTETLDYIWLNPNIEIVNSGPIMTKEQFKNKPFIPDKNNPSDHFMIYGTITIKG